MKKLRVIALMAKSQAGKDTAGKMLTEDANAVTMAFANKLKSICGEMFALDHAALHTEEGKAKPTGYPCFICPECKTVEVEEVKDLPGQARCKVCGVIGETSVFRGFWTPRTILQYVGTECFRRIHPGVWTNYALNLARRHLEKHPPGEAGTYGNKDFVVITDCRFPNEAEAVWAAGGEVWRIYRPETDGKQAGLKGHASEIAMDKIADSKFQAIIRNDSTLEVFRGRLAAELKRFFREHP